MKKIALVVVLIAASVFLFSACNIAPVSAYDKEILKGNSLTYESLSELREDWDIAQGGDGTTNAVTIFSDDVNNGVKIDTTNAGGWAYITQKVFLKTNSYYKITYEYSSSSMSGFSEDPNFIGFFVGFLEDPNFNIGSEKPIEETVSSNGKKTVELYFHTNRVQEAHLAFRVGTEERPVSASNVTIYSVGLTRVKAAQAQEAEDAGEEIYQLNSNVFGKATILNTPYVIVGGIATVVFIYIAFVLLRRAMAKGDSNLLKGKAKRLIENKYFIPAIVLSAAFLIRLVIALTMSLVAKGKETLFLGFEAEKIIEQGLFIANHGPRYMFKHLEIESFMPGQFYLAGVVGLLLRMFGSESGALAIFFIKFISILADLGAVYIIYSVAIKKFSKVSASIIALSYSLLPAVFTLSGVYGSWSSVIAFLVLLVFYFMLNKDLLGLGISYFFALILSPYAITLAPVVLMYLVYIAIGDNSKILPITIGVVASVVLFYLVGLPFVINDVAKGKAFYMFTLYIETLKQGSFYTMNALNFQALLNNNFQEITTESTFITILFQLLFLGLLGVVAFKNKNRLDFVLSAGMYLSLLVVFTNRMDQYSMYLLLPITLLGGIITKDKRLMAVAVLYSAILFVNTVYVSSILGYQEAGYLIIENRAILSVFGVLSLLVSFLHFFSVYDIVVSRQAYEVMPMLTTYPQRIVSVGKLIAAKWRLGISKIKGVFTKG